MRKKFALLLIALIGLSGIVFAQAKTSLVIQSNQVGASVYLNNVFAGYASPSLELMVSPGMYIVRVTKEGFPEFKTTVVVGSSPITIVANLGNIPTPVNPPKPVEPPPPPQFQLKVDANRQGANVYLDGKFVGSTPLSIFVRPGTYSVRISTSGYSDYTRVIRVNGSYSFYASLDPLPYPVYIDVSNVEGAAVYRDSVYMGTTPYRGVWEQGRYSVRITAPGYYDYNEKMSVNGPSSIQAYLSPALVDYEIRVPAIVYSKKGESLEFRDFRFLIDGERLKGAYGQIPAGKHTLTMYLDDYRFDMDFEILSGKSVIIEPFFGVRVR